MTDTATTTTECATPSHRPAWHGWTPTATPPGTGGETIEEPGAFDEEQRVRYAEQDGYGGAVVRVPADEPASLADVMELAAEVESLKRARLEKRSR